MRRRIRYLGLWLVLVGVSAVAQQAVTTAGGTANSVPKFSGSTTLVNSEITESNGKVGIGTMNPIGILDTGGEGGLVVSGVDLDPRGLYSLVPLQNTGKMLIGWNWAGSPGEIDLISNRGLGNSGGFNFYDYTNSGALNALVAMQGNGNVGIGTTTPGYNLDIFTPVPSGVDTYSGLQIRGGTYGYLLEGGLKQSAGAILKFSSNNNGTINERMRIDQNGNVGIGTTTPGAPLEVRGDIKLTYQSGGSLTFADGTTQTTAWLGTLSGGDYAETVNASGDHKKYEPGDVLVLSDDNESDVSKSSQSYSTLVAGIYSTKPGLVGRRQTGKKIDAEIPMAMVGIVPTKVSAENGPIRKGDLLVTSSTEGYAMKGIDRSQMLGAIVGKAMGNLDSGTGVIEVLVSLQ